jgi:hypothetical protein
LIFGLCGGDVDFWSSAAMTAWTVASSAAVPLAAIETAVARHPDLVHYRVL